MTLEPQTRTFVDTIAGAGRSVIGAASLEAARKALLEAQAGHVVKPAADIVDLAIAGGPTGTIRLRVVRPRGDPLPLPAVMYFHGGGWALGGTDTHDRLVREIAIGAGAAVVFVDYDRAPEAQYPIAVEQAYAATQHVSENAKALNVDASRLAVAGDCVGGTIAAAVALMAKERGSPRIGFQLLLYPATDAAFDTASYSAFADGPWLTRDAMRRFWDAYLPDHAKRSEPTAAPLRASLEQLKGLPPALIITDENDVVRDEGEAYARKLSAAGVGVTAVRYLGTIHDFMMLNSLADTPAARGATAQATDALRFFFDSQ